MPRFDFYETAQVRERALLVGVSLPDDSIDAASSLEELARLAQTAGAVCVSELIQKLDHPNPRTYLGKGKIEELKSLARTLKADVVIFDNELSPQQQLNIEKVFGEGYKIIDRTALILDIFAMHAQTKEGRLQVQLAQMQYLLPRLRGMWSHLVREQTRGGIGSRFGQGESQLEIDRRLIRKRISSLKRELSRLELRRQVQAGQRGRSGVFRVSLVGYTNAGKSSMMNRLTGSSVYVQDELFATLDATTRSLELEDSCAITITDTVGFINKLPHNLIEAFKSTLAEARSADLLLIVVDASDENAAFQLECVRDVLADIGADNIPNLLVFNKLDLLDEQSKIALLHTEDALFTSAETGEGVKELCERIASAANNNNIELEALIPYSEGSLVHLAHTEGSIIDEDFVAEGTLLKFRIPRRYANRFEEYLLVRVPS